MADEKVGGKAQDGTASGAAQAKKVTKKTASAVEVDVVQMKKKLPIKRPVAKATAAVKTRKVKAAPARNIGLGLPVPDRSCDDQFCPYHGGLSVRGIILDVQIVSRKMHGTVVCKRERRHYIKKYQRFEKRTSRYLAHLPGCMDYQVGDMVKIAECRPLSKATSFVVVGRV